MEENQTITVATGSVPQLPKSGTLSSAEFRAWLKESLIFSVAVPSVIVFLTSLSGNGLDVKAAAVAMCYAGVSALTNLLMKYSKGL